MQTLTLTPIVGLPQFDGWSQVISNSDHSFVCVFSIQGDNSGNVGRDVVDILNQFSPQDAHELHQNLEDVDQLVQKKECNLAIAGALFIEERCFLGTKSGSICLKRGDKVGKLVAAQSEIVIVEGSYKREDVFVLFTQQAESFYGEIQQKLSQGFDVDTIITSIVPGLRNIDNSSLCALGFLQVAPAQETIVETVEAPITADDISLDEDTVALPVVESSATPIEAPHKAEKKQATDADPIQGKYFDGSQILQKTSVIATPKPSLLARLKGFFLAFSLSQLTKNRFSHQVRNIANSRLAVKKKFTFSKTKQQKMIRILIPILILIIVGGGYWYMRHSKIQAEVAAEQAKIAPFKQRLDQAKDRAATDPISVRDEVNEVVTELTAEAQLVQQNKPVYQVVQDVLIEAQTFHQSIAGKEEVNQLPLFYDLRLVESDFVAKAAQISEDNAYFFDAGKGHIIQLNLTNKQSRKFEINDVQNAQDFGINSNSAFILKQGVVRFGLKDDSTLKVIPENDTNREATALKTFGSFLYVLVPANRNIYKYTDDSEGKYSDAVSWVRSARGIDMDQIASLAVDGDIWLGDKTGNLYRLRSGNRIDFEVKGLTDAFNSSLTLETKEEDVYLYVLEANQQRLVVLDKNGQFIKEIKSESLASASVLMVDEPRSKAYVVSGSEVFEIQL